MGWWPTIDGARDVRRATSERFALEVGAVDVWSRRRLAAVSVEWIGSLPDGRHERDVLRVGAPGHLPRAVLAARRRRGSAAPVALVPCSTREFACARPSDDDTHAAALALDAQHPWGAGVVACEAARLVERVLASTDPAERRRLFERLRHHPEAVEWLDPAAEPALELVAAACESSACAPRVDDRGHTTWRFERVPVGWPVVLFAEEPIGRVSAPPHEMHSRFLVRVR